MPSCPKCHYQHFQKALDVAKKYPEKLIEMKQLAQALYHTSKYLIYHNPNTLE
jgi:hypothetical protein